MSFKKMPISKKIILGYVIFFVILIVISAFVTVQNIVSLNNANTLSANDEFNLTIKDALSEFLNARVGARILMLTDNYDDETYTSTAAQIDSCTDLLNKGLTLAKENKMTQREQIINEAIANAAKYKTLLANLHTLNRDRAANKDSLPALGRQAMDALMNVVNAENEAIRSGIRNGNQNLLNEYDNFYEFSKIREMMYNTRLVSTKLSYLNDITSYESIMASLAEVKTALNDFGSTAPARREAVSAALTALDVYGGAFTENYNMLSQNNDYTSALISTNEDLQTSLGNASTLASQGLNDMVDKILSSATASLWVVIVLMVVAVVLNIFLAIMIVSSINKSLNNAMAKLNETTMSVVSASGELLSAAGSLAQGGSEQAAAIEETSATMNETASMVQQNTENTREAAALANDTANAALKGVNEMETLIQFMDKLSKSSGEISKIVDSINTIAFQTNILALNASVEAVRAGDAGKSFAVVAEEVRSLSQSSSDAANNTSTIITENIELSNQSVQNSKNVGETLKTISSAIQKVTNLVNEISAASEEQSRGVQQINIALSQMEKVTQSSAAISEQSAAAANELMNQANTLERITEELHALVGN